MSERGVLRRSESPLRSATWWPFLASALVAACIAGSVGVVRAQVFAGLSPADSAALADSLKAAEEQRVADSTATADSLENEQELEAAEGAFSGSQSILDRAGRSQSPFSYNSSYSVNRSNRTWGQTMDFHGTRGPLEVANLTTATIGREGRVGRVNRSGQTQTELAYRVSSVLRLGGRFGIQRVTDVAQSASVVPTDQSNDDLSAQARFNRKFGTYPVQSIMSYGYLRRDQLDQKSRGTNLDFYAGGSGSYRPGSTFKVDFTQRSSNLRSTVVETAYESVDRNSSTNVNLSTISQINAWTAADASLQLSRQTVRRPLVTADPNDPTNTDAFITVPEVVATTNDQLNGGIHFTLPYRTRVNVSANASRNHVIYQAQVGSSSIIDRHEVNADLSKFLLGSDWTVRFGQSVQDNDLTARDPGYVQTDLQRKLEGEGSHRLSKATSSRLSLGVYLQRRDFNDYVSASGNPNSQSAQDNLKVRGSLNFNYLPTNKFDTGVTFGIEQNDVVNLRNTSSINNARLRTYSVAWNWGVRPGGIWSVNQVNSATAQQQFYTFAPTRDVVSYVYTLTTNIATIVSSKLRFDLNHLIRLQSRGSFRASEEGIRRFGKSSEFNTLDLVLREQYSPDPALTFEISQRLSVNPQFEFQGTEGTKTTENRRDELTFLTRFNYPLGRKATLNADVRRILATDRNTTFGTQPTDRSTNNDYWLVTAAFRMEFL